MDTSKDPRILGLEMARKVLDEAFRSKKPFYMIAKKEEKSLLQEIERLINVIKRSYMEPQDIVELDETKRLVNIGKELRDKALSVRAKEGPHIYLARLMYVGRTFRSFPDRLLNRPGKSMVEAVDIVTASAIAVHKITDKLLLVRAGDGIETYDVVTNILSVKRGEVRPIAFLPPKEFFGHVSEAMFASSEPINEEAGKRILWEDPSLEGIVGHYLKHYKVLRVFSSLALGLRWKRE